MSPDVRKESSSTCSRLGGQVLEGAGEVRGHGGYSGRLEMLAQADLASQFRHQPAEKRNTYPLSSWRKQILPRL